MSDSFKSFFGEPKGGEGDRCKYPTRLDTYGCGRSHNCNYCPENCRWATLDEQNNNKRNCVYVTIDGVTKTVTEWCKETGVSRTAAYGRIRNGWNPVDAVTVTDPNVGRKRASEAKFKPVIVDGTDRFESITEAAKHLGISPHLVSHAARNGHRTNGHTVEYA